jgi:hypothetical protein
MTNVACNLLESLDPASTPQQILSKARACFNQSDYSCAQAHYAQLKNTELADTAILEQIEVELYLLSINPTFLSNLVKENPNSAGDVVNAIAAQIYPIAGQTTRLAILTLYQSAQTITNGSIKALASFLTSIALLGELFSEAITSNDTFYESNLVSIPSACLSNLALYEGAPTNLTYLTHIETYCARPSGSVLIAGSDLGTLAATTVNDWQGSPTLFMVIETISAVVDSIGDIPKLTKYSQYFTTLETLIEKLNPAISLEEAILRGFLVQNSIGETG